MRVRAGQAAGVGAAGGGGAGAWITAATETLPEMSTACTWYHGVNPGEGRS